MPTVKKTTLADITPIEASEEPTTQPAPSADNPPFQSTNQTEVLTVPATELDAELVDNQRVIGASMRCKYGAVEIEYEIRQIANPQTLAEQFALQDKLTLQLEGAHDHFAEQHLAKLKYRGEVKPNGTQGQFQKARPS